MVVIPPRALAEAGVVDSNERWIVEKALYGLPTSPADWGAFRDARLRQMTWQSEGKEFALRPTHEMNLWQIKELVPETQDELTRGYLAVYVDDMLAAGEDSIVNAPQQSTCPIRSGLSFVASNCDTLLQGRVFMWRSHLTCEIFFTGMVLADPVRFHSRSLLQRKLQWK